MEILDEFGRIISNGCEIQIAECRVVRLVGPPVLSNLVKRQNLVLSVGSNQKNHCNGKHKGFLGHWYCIFNICEII